jgi:putative membrane protein
MNNLKKKTNVSFTPSSSFIEFIIDTLVGAIILMLAQKIFNNIYISSFGYAFLAALIISLLNNTIKYFLVIFLMPITILSLGLCYPVVDVIILKLTSLFLGGNFIIKGWIVPFFIAIFISIMKSLYSIFFKGGRS